MTTTEPTGTTGTSGPWEATELELRAERAVLGAMLTPLHATGRDGTIEALSSPAIADVRRVLVPEHLYRTSHQTILRAVCDLADAGRRGIDAVVVASELHRRGELIRVGGAPYLHQLMTSVPTTVNADYYAEIVREGANRRAAYALSQRIAQAAASAAGGSRLAEVITGLHAQYTTAVSTTSGDDLPSVANSTDLIDSVVSTWGEPQPSSMTTGLADVDSVLNVDDGALVVLAGRPGSGKSTLGAQVAGHYAMIRAEPAIMFSVEMTRAELVQRDIARLARVRLDSATGKTGLGHAEAQRVVAAAGQYRDRGAALWYDDTPHLTLAHIRARCAEVTATAGSPRLVVVDYLQLMQMPKADRKDLAIGELSRGLKLLAQEMGCIVLLLCQLNRGPEGRPGGVPMASDLRESGNLEQDADVVMLLHDVARYVDGREGEVDLILAKQRKGVSGRTVALADRRAFAEFGDLTHRRDGRSDLDQAIGEEWWQK